MKHSLICLSLTISSLAASAQQYDSSYGKPLIVLIETDPWAMVIGSDVPSFALYEKGQIIYKKIENRHLKIYEVKLDNDELQKVIKTFGITDPIYKLPNEIATSFATDQPDNKLLLNFDSAKLIDVYGSLRDKSGDRDKTPQEFLTVYDNIKNYKSDSAKEWLPKKIEVMFWEYNYALSKRPWIKGFPDLSSSSTIKRGDMYSVYIDRKDFDEFKKFYSSIGGKQAVEINGKKMAIDYRLPFPNLQ